MGYVYIRSERKLFTVGFYDPAGTWNPDSDHEDRNKAAARVHYLNGGDQTIHVQALREIARQAGGRGADMGYRAIRTLAESALKGLRFGESEETV